MPGNHTHRTARLSLLVLAAILLLASTLRLWQIGTLPPGFHFDESFEGLEAWRILTDQSYRPIFLTGNFGVTPLNAYANALTFAVFQWLGHQPGPAAMRVTAAIAGVLGVLAVYGLARELRHLDPRRLTPAFPFLAAGTLAVMRWHIHFSRMGIEPIFVPLLWAAATWLLLAGWRTASWLAFAGSGVLIALAMYTYQGAWTIPFLMIPVTLHLWLFWRQRTDRTSPRLLGSLAAGFIAFLLVLPLALYFVDQPDLLLLRPAQIAVTGTSEAANPGQAVTPWDNTVASVLMFVPLGHTGDSDPRRNIPGEAALNWWQFLPFAAGVALALWRWRNPAYTTILVGLAGMLIVGVFSEYAPHFHRILGASAPAALLCAVGLDVVLRWGRVYGRAETDAHDAADAGAHMSLRWQAWASILVVASLLVAGSVTAARDYFVRWAALPDLFYAFDVGLWQLGQEMAQEPAAEPVYLSPRPAGHPTLAFALAIRPGSHDPPVSFDGRQIFPLTAGKNAVPERYFVVEHEDFRTHMLLPEVLPQAVISETVLDAAGQPYANLYVRPANTEPQRPPQHLVDTVLGDGIRLLGYDVQPAELHPGEILYLQLHWLVDAVPAQDWIVFTHLLAPAGQAEDSGASRYVQVAGQDGRPGGGSLPTTRWQSGWRVLDEYQIALPADIAPGTYTLAAGLYQPDDTGTPARLPAEGEGIVLGEVVIGE